MLVAGVLVDTSGKLGWDIESIVTCRGSRLSLDGMCARATVRIPGRKSLNHHGKHMLRPDHVVELGASGSGALLPRCPLL